MSWFCTLSVAYRKRLVGSMAMPVGVDPAEYGLPGSGVSAPFEATEKPEMVPCAGQVAGVAGAVPVVGAEVVTMTELVFVAYANLPSADTATPPGKHCSGANAAPEVPTGVPSVPSALMG